MLRFFRRPIVGCLFALLTLGVLAATDASTAAPAAPAHARLAPAQDFPGSLTSGGWLRMRLANTSDGRIRVTWKGPRTNRGLKKWVVLTSTTRKMNRHVRAYRVRRGKRSAIVSPANLVTPSSGDYTFVKLKHYWKKPRRHVGQSPTLWIKPTVPTPPSGVYAAVVGTFNVRSWKGDRPSTPYPWSKRRARVLRTINSSGAGVVALQETSGLAGHPYGSEIQWLDVLHGANAATDRREWALVDRERYQTYADDERDGRQGTRILYDTLRYQLVDRGVSYAQGPNANAPCWLPWAHLRQRSSGREFVVVAAHLQHGTDPQRGEHPLWVLRNAQTKKLIEVVRSLRTRFPGEQVIVAGDLNSTSYTAPDNGVHRLLVSAGFFDAFASRDIYRGNMPTTNDFKFPVRPTPHRRDYIVSYGSLRGSYWFHNLAYSGAASVASDHYMQVASLPIG